MSTGTITASTLRLRKDPSVAADNTIEFVHKGTEVDILAEQPGWLRVLIVEQGVSQRGWVSSDFVARDPAPAQAVDPASAKPPLAAPAPEPPATGLPPAEIGDNKVTVTDDHAFGPDGTKFATKFRFGFYSLGVTPAHDWIAANAASLTQSPSVQNVVKAVSRNEGKFEAVNTWDNSFLSFGLVQWTAGSGANPGELAGLLDDIKNADAASFEALFGTFGLDFEIGGSGVLQTGMLLIDGKVLATADEKQVLREPEWAYRFWRAGHHEIVRKCQFDLAAKRIKAITALTCDGRALTEWLTSQHGVALLLDEHVNRPGAVVSSLKKALDSLGAAADPASWSDADEQKLIAAYVAARNGTTMTNPGPRAKTIQSAIDSGELDGKRGSFEVGN